jgi:NitT/TauT family transport system substrate-binding protein
MKQQAFQLVFSLLTCVMLLSLFITGCGTTPPTNSMILKVAQVNNSISFFPLYVAEQKNFFKAQGLTLNPYPPAVLGGGPKVSEAVEAGSVDIGVGAVTDAFTISRVDAYIRMIGALTNGFLNDVTVSKRFEQQTHVIASSPLAEKVQALRGKKIGVSAPNSASDALVTYLFRQQGINDQRDVVKVDLGADTATNLAALQAGRVDAIVNGVPAGEEAEARGIGDIFISPVRGDVPAMQGQLYGVFYARQQVIDAKPKAVQAFIRAIAQAESFIQKNPAQTIILLGKFLKLDQKTANGVWRAAKASMPLTPQISQQTYSVANEFHVKAGLIALALPYNDLVATDTINQALSSLPSSS